MLEALKRCQPQDYFEAALDVLAEDGTLRLRTTDVTASFCMEIDTPTDLAAALTHFRGHEETSRAALAIPVQGGNTHQLI